MTTDARQQEYWEAEHGFRRYDHPVVELFAEQRLRMFRRWIDFSAVRRALDVGCGDGFSTFYTRRHIRSVWATDRSNVMLSRHPLRRESRLAAADARALPYRDGVFDLVYGWEILHHVSDPVAVVAEMARVSSRYVLVAEPNRYNPAQFAFALYDTEHRWVLRYSPSYLAGLCSRAGLRIVKASTGGLILPNRTPAFMAKAFARLPYEVPLGISNCVLAEKER